MRKITSQAVNKFYSKENFNQSNTEVFYSKSQNTSYLSLHGNTIAILHHDTNKLMISNCGWQTNTTKERLNGLKEVNIHQKNFVWYLNGKEWDGNLIEVKQ